MTAIILLILLYCVITAAFLATGLKITRKVKSTPELIIKAFITGLMDFFAIGIIFVAVVIFVLPSIGDENAGEAYILLMQIILGFSAASAFIVLLVLFIFGAVRQGRRRKGKIS